MKFLWFISLLILVIPSSCVRIKPPDLTRIREVPESASGKLTRHSGPSWIKSYFRNDSTNNNHSSSYLFKASLDIKKHRLSGLLVIKQMDPVSQSNDQDQFSGPVYRVVFANEIGMTFFDLEITQKGLRVINCFKSLNKKALMKILETDFRLLTGIDPVKHKKIFRQSFSNNVAISGKTQKYSTWHTFSSKGDTLFKTAGRSTIADPVIITYENFADASPIKITIENPVIGLKLLLRRLTIQK